METQTPQFALSLTQPWASLVACGQKQIETRSFKRNFYGPLAIHAAKAFPRECQRLCREEPFQSALQHPGIWTTDGLPRGAIIAVCEVVSVFPLDRVPPQRIVVNREPGIALREALAQVHHHYRTDSTARACLAKWILGGSVPGVRLERDGKRLVLHPGAS